MGKKVKEKLSHRAVCLENLPEVLNEVGLGIARGKYTGIRVETLDRIVKEKYPDGTYRGVSVIINNAQGRCQDYKQSKVYVVFVEERRSRGNEVEANLFMLHTSDGRLMRL